MELVIYISPKAYSSILECGYVSCEFNVISAVRAGVPLKHHGRLGDLDALEDELRAREKLTDDAIARAVHKELFDCLKVVKDAPTVIPASE